jgi:hypothetical protein
VHDSATVTGTAAGGTPTGDVTFSVWLGTTECPDPEVTPPDDTATVNLDASGVAHPALAKVVPVTGLAYQATYNGSATYNPSTSDCEPLSPTKLGSSTATTIHDADHNPITSAPIGSTVHDSATVTGTAAGGTPTGDVTFTFFTGGNCETGTPVASGTVSLDANGVAHPSDSQGPLGAGNYAFQATYNGSTTYSESTSACEPFTVDKASPGITTTPNPTSGNVGVTLNDSATLSNGFNPTGSITFKLYDPDQSSCTGTPRYTQTGTVNGNGTYTTSPGFVTDKAGTWRWTADYSGDGNNNPTSSGCNDEQVVINQPVISKITPTQTTCAQFKAGTAAQLSELLYTTKGNPVTINSVSPGVFFYWIKLENVAAGSNTFTISQTITTANFDSHFFSQASGSFVFNSNCTKVATQTVNTSAGVTTVTFTAPTAGTYFIGVKYDSGSVKGFAPPSGGTAHYDFSTGGVPGSTQGIDLKPKP